MALPWNWSHFCLISLTLRAFAPKSPAIRSLTFMLNILSAYSRVSPKTIGSQFLQLSGVLTGFLWRLPCHVIVLGAFHSLFCHVFQGSHTRKELSPLSVGSGDRFRILR